MRWISFFNVWNWNQRESRICHWNLLEKVCEPFFLFASSSNFRPVVRWFDRGRREVGKLETFLLFERIFLILNESFHYINLKVTKFSASLTFILDCWWSVCKWQESTMNTFLRSQKSISQILFSINELKNNLGRLKVIVMSNE